ncbi:MAG: EamA family transporter, partial [Candidatus Puniceispirillaceae bacterium]
MTDEAETQAVGAGRRLTRSPLFGIGLALLGALIITPDTLLIRLSGLEGWPLTAWRGLLIGGSMLLGWMIMAGRQMGADLRQMATMPFLVIMLANGGNTLCFNFAAVETSIIVVLTALATVPVLAALLSFVILREATTRRTWQAIVMTMAGVLIVVFNGEGAVAAPEGSVFL